MPALSLYQIETLLAPYAPSDGTFLPRINQALARLHNMGTYRDLTVQYSLPVVNTCITLPDDAEALLHAMIDGEALPVRSLWHDFKTVGLSNNGDLSWGFIDAGYCPVLRDIAEPTDTLYIVPADSSLTRLEFDSVNGGTVDITAVGELHIVHVSTAEAGFDGEQLIFGEDIQPINMIRFDSLQDRYDIRTDPLDPATTIATVGPDSGVTRYRRFRIPGSRDGEQTVHVLCKRAFCPLARAEDVTYVGNINAIKNGLLATIAEDANDVERSEVFWNRCFQLMEEESSSSRGAAKPRLSIDPHGAEGRFGVQGML